MAIGRLAEFYVNCQLIFTATVKLRIEYEMYYLIQLFVLDWISEWSLYIWLLYNQLNWAGYSHDIAYRCSYLWNYLSKYCNLLQCGNRCNISIQSAKNRHKNRQNHCLRPIVVNILTLIVWILCFFLTFSLNKSKVG